MLAVASPEADVLASDGAWVLGGIRGRGGCY